MTAKIATDFWMKPIPPRQFDWSAWYDDDEPDDRGRMPVGYGATEQEAIENLKDDHPRCRDRGGYLDPQNGDCMKCGAAVAEKCREDAIRKRFAPQTAGERNG